MSALDSNFSSRVKLDCAQLNLKQLYQHQAVRTTKLRTT